MPMITFHKKRRALGSIPVVGSSYCRSKKLILVPVSTKRRGNCSERRMRNCVVVNLDKRGFPKKTRNTGVYFYVEPFSLEAVRIRPFSRGVMDPLLLHFLDSRGLTSNFELTFSLWEHIYIVHINLNTYKENNRWIANQCNSCGQLPLVAPTVPPCAPILVFRQIHSKNETVNNLWKSRTLR